MIKNSIKASKGVMNHKVVEKFLRDNSIDMKEARNKKDRIELIEKFGNESPQNKEIVNNWIDGILKEGQKHIYVARVEKNILGENMHSKSYWEQFMKNKKIKVTHLNEINPKINLNYESIRINEEKNNVTSVELVLAQKIYNLDDDDELSYKSEKKETYYVFADIDLSKDIIILRGVAKTNICSLKIRQDGEDIDTKISVDKILQNAIEKIENDIGINKKDKVESHKKVCYAYYKILEELIETPKEVEEKLELCRKEKFEDIKNVLKKQGVELERFEETIDKDIECMLEKFISISQPNKEIFKNNYGYPIKLIATDSENTRVEETAANFAPLQSKAAFYDHKKIIDQEKSCNGIYMYINRKESKIFNKGFIAKLDWHKGFARMRLEEYVEEEEINNVLSRITKFL